MIGYLRAAFERNSGFSGWILPVCWTIGMTSAPCMPVRAMATGAWPTERVTGLRSWSGQLKITTVKQAPKLIVTTINDARARTKSCRVRHMWFPPRLASASSGHDQLRSRHLWGSFTA